MVKRKTVDTERLVWMGLLSIAVVPFLGLLNALFRIVFDPASFQPSTLFYPVMVGVLFSLGFAIATLVDFIQYRKMGERSWKMWVGFIPAFLVFCFWMFMIVGELVFPH